MRFTFLYIMIPLNSPLIKKNVSNLQLKSRDTSFQKNLKKNVYLVIL